MYHVDSLRSVGHLEFVNSDLVPWIKASFVPEEGAIDVTEVKVPQQPAGTNFCGPATVVMNIDARSAGPP